MFTVATTQPTTQNNLKQFCWGGIIMGYKKTPPHFQATSEADYWYASLL